MCHIMHYRTAAGNIRCENFREFRSIAALRESYCFGECLCRVCIIQCRSQSTFPDWKFRLYFHQFTKVCTCKSFQLEGIYMLSRLTSTF